MNDEIICKNPTQKIGLVDDCLLGDAVMVRHSI